MSKKIFVALSIFAQYGQEPLDLLKGSGFSYTLNTLGRRLTKKEVIQLGRDCYGIVAGLEPYDTEVLENMENLECISRCGVGTDNIDHEKAKEKNIKICNTPEVVIQPVAELTVAFIFDLLKRLTFYTALLRAKRWERTAGNLLQGKKTGILGLGRIGKRTAQLLKSLGAEVFGTDIKPDHNWAKELGIKIISCEELLKIVDILSIHLACTQGQPFQLGGKEIAMMKTGAMIVNTSRGQFIDETALYEALKNKKLSGAALDVFKEEPYTGELCALDNVILTPHIATLTKESRLHMEIEATQNLIESLQKKGRNT